MSKNTVVINGIEMEIVWRCSVCKTPAPKEGQMPSDGFHRECFIAFHKDFFSEQDMAECLEEMSFPNG